MNPIIPGIGLMLFSALCNAGMGVPLRIRRRYDWENMWIIGHGFAMIILPLILGYFLVPSWPAAVKALGGHTLALVMVFGFLWGIGAVLFAVGIDAIGLSLGYAVIMGIITALGSVIPMARRWSSIPTDAGIVILIGIGVCILGVAICGKAGMLREKGVDQKAASGSAASMVTKSAAGVFAVGLAWCILSGTFSSGNNLGFDYAEGVATEAVKMGASPIFASFARFIPVYWGGYLAVLIACLSRLIKNRSWVNYGGAGAARDAALSFAMGVLHFTCQLAYGAGAYYIGKLGTTVGWAVMISSSIIFANLFGFVTGEWKAAVKKSVNVLYLGLAVLIVAVLILAYGNGMVQR